MKRPWDAIVWWELRRIPYNLLLLVLGLATVFIILEVGSYLERLGENIEMPLAPFGLLLAIIAYGIAANVFYTLGWISELLWSRGDTSNTEAMRGTVFWSGVVFSAVLTVSPAILASAAGMIFRFTR